jgi:predicted nucleotidyltransferase
MSIIDIPRKTYAKGVFNDADTDNPKLKPGVVAMIKSQIKKFESKAPVSKYSLIGSILTKRYREDADLDINVLFDVEPSYRETMRQQLASQLRSINGKLIPGTKHPINYYVITDPKVKEKADKEADGVFDVENNKFLRKPDAITFDPKQYESDFRKKVEEIDVIKGELVRDIIDYKELKQLTKDDVDGIQKLVSDKIKEIEESIKVLIDIGDELLKQRQSAFANPMTPEEIRKFGIKNKLPKNVIYKMLEKYHYSKLYKKCKEVLEDGKVTDDEIKSMTEAKKGSVVFTFGRFNPPTIGHEKLIDRLARVRANEMRVYISKSNDPKKNPLNPRQKLDYMKKIFPRYARNIFIPRTNIVIDIITDLYKEGFTDLKMVVGSDRVNEFKTLITKYNDVKSRHGYYNFDNIEVISAGERDPDAEGATGMSASKMRAAAQANDLKTFEKGLPNFRGVDKLFKDVRKGMNLAASYTTGMGHMNYRPIASLEQFEQNQIRDMYIREMLFNVGDIVENVHLNVKGTVTRRGTNYVVLEDDNNNLHKSWIWDCIPVPPDREIEVREHNLNVDYGFKTVREEDMKEDLDAQPQDKDVKKKKGTQPKKYYKSLSKDVKSKRADHFAKQDTTKGPYKPAPGDKDAKTKPSIHTKKYKQMYGEMTQKEACWDGYKAVGMKKKNGKMVPNCVPESMSIEDAKKVEGYVPESYEVGQDYANHTKDITPGENASEKPVDSKKRTPENRITADDVKEWAVQDETIDKYKGRYGDKWKSKLVEVTKKMMDKVDEKF